MVQFFSELKATSISCNVLVYIHSCIYLFPFKIYSLTLSPYSNTCTHLVMNCTTGG